MKWNFVGEIREYNIDRHDLCSNTDNSISVFFPSKEGCQKYKVSKHKDFWVFGVAGGRDTDKVIFDLWCLVCGGHMLRC